MTWRGREQAQAGLSRFRRVEGRGRNGGGRARLCWRASNKAGLDSNQRREKSMAGQGSEGGQAAAGLHGMGVGNEVEMGSGKDFWRAASLSAAMGRERVVPLTEKCERGWAVGPGRGQRSDSDFTMQGARRKDQEGSTAEGEQRDGLGRYRGRRVRIMSKGEDASHMALGWPSSNLTLISSPLPRHGPRAAAGN